MCREVRETETPLFTGSEPEDRLAVGVNLIAFARALEPHPSHLPCLLRFLSHQNLYDHKLKYIGWP